jgi:hypothetical protein
LATINIPDGVTAINAHTFQGAGLISIELPETVTSLKTCAFQNASALASINLANISGTGGYALSGTAISSVELMDVSVIGTEAFRNCPNLESFTLLKESAEEFSKADFTWVVPAELANVYGTTWQGYPVSVITGIEYVSVATTKLISENHGIRIVDGKNLNGTVTVYSVTGVKLYTHSGRIDNITVELPAGVYVVNVTSPESVMTSKAIAR